MSPRGQSMISGIEFSFQIALGDFSLNAQGTIPARGITALFGRSGCGKTSLLRCIAGLLQADTAYFRLNNDLWHDSKNGIFVPTHKRAIGYVFQDGRLFPHLSVEQNLLYGHQRTSREDQHSNLQHIIQLLALKPLLTRQPGQLSGGEKQRVAIGRALLCQPRVLLMDEPMAALDRGHKREILPYLKRLHSEAEIPIIYVTHDLDELAQISDNLMLIEDGKIMAQGPLQDVLARTDLPIVRDEDAGALFKTHILEHDEQYHLTRLGFKGGELTVGWIDRPVDSEVRIRIHAKDVSLSLEAPGGTSILNVLPVTIKEMAIHGRGRMIIQLDLGGEPLLARITRKSHDRLGLAIGMQLYAQIKSVALTL